MKTLNGHVLVKRIVKTDKTTDSGLIVPDSTDLYEGYAQYTQIGDFNKGDKLVYKYVTGVYKEFDIVKRSDILVVDS